MDRASCACFAASGGSVGAGCRCARRFEPARDRLLVLGQGRQQGADPARVERVGDVESPRQAPPRLQHPPPGSAGDRLEHVVGERGRDLLEGRLEPSEAEQRVHPTQPGAAALQEVGQRRVGIEGHGRSGVRALAAIGTVVPAP